MTVEQTVTVIDASGEAVSLTLRNLLFLRGTDMYALLKELGFSQDFKDPDFENILARMLSRVPDTLDKRQGSIIYDALAPAAVELTEAYIEREANRALSYAVTSVGEWLDMRVAEHGVTRMPATKAVRYGWFWADDAKTVLYDPLPIGGRYSVPNDALNYIATKKVTKGVFEMTCEEAGEIGNEPQSGSELIPVEYVSGLASVELGDIITPGEDEETDAALHARFVRYITRPPFGGNRADYEEYFRQIDGIGYVRLYRADPEKGHVTAYILGADEQPPSSELLETAQTLIDPVVNSGEGIGMAPMAHMAHVYGAEARTVDVYARLVLIRGWTIGQVEEGVKEAIEAYFLELRKGWSDYVALDSHEYVDCIVRIAQLDAAILTVDGVADVFDTTLDGLETNLSLEPREVPMAGVVSLGT